MSRDWNKPNEVQPVDLFYSFDLYHSAFRSSPEGTTLSRRLILLGILLAAAALAVGGGIYTYSQINAGPRTVTVSELLSSPNQYADTQVKVTGKLAAIYDGEPTFRLLAPTGERLVVTFPEEVWGAPPRVGEYLGKDVEITGVFRVSGAQGDIGVIEVQSITLAEA